MDSERFPDPYYKKSHKSGVTKYEPHWAKPAGRYLPISQSWTKLGKSLRSLQKARNARLDNHAKCANSCPLSLQPTTRRLSIKNESTLNIHVSIAPQDFNQAFAASLTNDSFSSCTMRRTTDRLHFSTVAGQLLLYDAFILPPLLCQGFERGA
jgi:hypothetical protein